MGDADNGLHLSGILLAVVLLATWMFQSEPLAPTRPSGDDQLKDSGQGYQDVPARLWQDPFATVDRYRAQQQDSLSISSPNAGSFDIPLPPRQLDSLDAHHGIQRLTSYIQDSLSDATDSFTVIPILTPTAPYAETKEHRYRLRTAVIAALTRNDITPEDGQHLGYWHVPAVPKSEQHVAVPEVAMPYELFAGERRKVLVLWLPAKHLQRQPVYRLGLLAQLLRKNLFSPAQQDIRDKRLVFLEAMGSSILASIGNTPDRERPVGQGLQDTTFIAATATTPASGLLEGCSAIDTRPACSEQALQDRFARFGVRLVRSVATDDRLAASLIAELKLRRIDPTCLDPDDAPYPLALWPCYRPDQADDAYGGHRDHIVLISEADTLFGRTLPALFNAQVYGQLPEQRRKALEAKQRLGARKELPWIHRFGYLRGVDGELPNTKDAEGKTDSPSGTTSLQDLSQLDALALEPASGTSQFDYLRRLADKVRVLDRQLQQHEQGRIKAIGILGNDLHDKLAILKVLRVHFPNHQYFTNDLDARLLSPKDYRNTRNLIVASSFGLELSDRWQGKVPPSRGNYQTSVFLATQLAIAESGAVTACALREQLLPRIHEVGRNRFIDLGPVLEARSCGADTGPDLGIHPPAYQAPSAPPQLGWIVLSLGLALVLVVLLTPPLLSLLIQAWREHRAMLLLSVIALGLSVPALSCLYRLMKDSAEPFVWAAGVSIWPSELLRLLATALSLLFLVLANRRLTRDTAELQDRFGLTGINVSKRPRLEQIKDTFCWYAETPREKKPQGKLAALWPIYCEHAQTSRRLARAFLLFALLWTIAFVSVTLVTQIDMPFRGDTSYRFSFWLGMGPLAVFFGMLLFWIMDETHLCRSLISRICNSEQDWAETATTSPAQEPSDGPGLQLDIPNALPEEPSDAWLENKRKTVDFIARRTESAGDIIWYPFVILILILISMSTRFDNYDTRGAVIGLLGAAIAIALSSAYLLRRTARKSKQHILDELRAGMLSQKREQAAETPDKVELLIQQIEDIHQGAFRPWYQEPLIRALAWVGSMGAVIITEYVSVSG